MSRSYQGHATASAYKDFAISVVFLYPRISGSPWSLAILRIPGYFLVPVGGLGPSILEIQDIAFKLDPYAVSGCGSVWKTFD